MSCCEVFMEIIRRPRNENLLWIYFLRPLVYILGFVVLIGLVYLYTVPFTNVVGMGLFGDFTCPNGVWIHCNPVDIGLFAFLIIQATLGLWILAFVFYGLSRRKGYIKKWRWRDCCRSAYCYGHPSSIKEWTKTDPNDRYNFLCFNCAAGPFLYVNSTILFFVAAIATATLIGIYGGHQIAINTIPKCMQYVNTTLGVHGCMENGGYVDNGCKSCTGLGFAILGIPLYLTIFISIYFYIVIKKCRAMYNEIKEEIQLEDDEFDPCSICLVKKPTTMLPCEHFLCPICVAKVNKCPLCRKKFAKDDLIESVSINL